MDLKNKSRFVLLIRLLFLLPFFLMTCWISYNLIYDEREQVRNHNLIRSYYVEVDELVEKVERDSKGIGYDYKAYLPNGEVDYIKIIDDNVEIAYNKKGS